MIYNILVNPANNKKDTFTKVQLAVLILCCRPMYHVVYCHVNLQPSL